MAILEIWELSGDWSGDVADDAIPTTVDTYTTRNVNKTLRFAGETATTFHNFSSTTHYTGSETDSSRYRYVLYAGSGISMVSFMIALFTYTTSRKFRVKRPHMITINLCLSLIIFYLGILLSASHMSGRIESAETQYNNSMLSQGCITGAIFHQFGTLYSWTWITVHWAYLTYRVYSVAAPHISHFFIKITLPAYGLPTLVACCIAGGSAAEKSVSYISTTRCFFNMRAKVVIVMNLLYIGICIAGITGCVAYCMMRLTCRKNKNQVASTHMRIKMSVLRLTVITSGVVAPSFLELIRWVVEQKSSNEWFEIFNGVVLGIVGIVIVIGLLFRSKEFRIHWMHAIRAVDLKHWINRADGTLSAGIIDGKTRQTSAVRRGIESLRRRSKLFRKGSRNSFDEYSTRGPNQPMSTSATFCENLTPPAKMVPRDGPAATSAASSDLDEVFLFPSQLPTVKDENDNMDNTPATVFNRNNSSAFVIYRNGSSHSTEVKDKKKGERTGSVNRISSVRKMVSRTSLRKSSQKRSMRFSTSSDVSVKRQASITATRVKVLEEDPDKISIASVEIFRKTSF